MSPARAHAGETVEVSAKWMWDRCNDTNVKEALHPLKDQPVVWRQSGATELARVDADETGVARAVVRVPATAVPGPASVQIGASELAMITVVD